MSTAQPAFTRRRIVLGLAATTLCAAGTGAEQPATLRELAGASGLQFGSGSDVVIAEAPAAYGTALARHCSVFTPRTAWTPALGEEETARGPRADPNIEFALRTGMRLAGGNLLWHGALRADVLAATPGSVARAMAAAHIDRTVGSQAGQAFSWCVVSEAIDTEAGDADGLRRSALLDKLGPDFMAAAFRTARAADPHALLAYDDTGVEMDTPPHAARRAALLRLLDQLMKDRTPIDAVGLQTHMRLDGTRFDPAVYRRFLREIAVRGLRIMITDMDVSDIAVPGDVAERDERVAAMYRDVLSVALAEPAVVSLVTSGMSDRYSKLATATDPGSCRLDGLPMRPLPLDDEFRAKPAFTAIATALRARI